MHPILRTVRRTAPLFAVLLSACTSDAAKIARLEKRLDSLAITLTAVTDRLNGTRTVGAESLTVAVPEPRFEGRADAPVTVVEFTDYQCPFCARHALTTLPEIRRAYIATGKVRYIIRDLPLLSIHPTARYAAIAGRCAADQGADRFRAFHDSMFAHQQGMTKDTVDRVARMAKLDLATFSACATSTRHDAALEADLRTADSSKFNGTPSFVIGPTLPGDSVHGVTFSGAYPLSSFTTAIEGALRSSSPSASGRGR